MTISASSCDCERLFSEFCDLLEPRQRAISEELLAAIQLIQSSLRSGFELPPDRLQSEVLDAETEQEYKVCNWSGLVN
jgi:hypothetical protein